VTHGNLGCCFDLISQGQLEFHEEIIQVFRYGKDSSTAEKQFLLATPGRYAGVAG
jgi:hypothetical protein